MEAVQLPEVDGSLEKALQILAKQTAFTISSCRQPDMPILYASPGFFELTGFAKSEVLGRNCRFLQGPGTSRQSVLEVRNALQEDRGCSVCLLNYRKDGKPFYNQLCLAPISDQQGVAYYLGIQTNVTGSVLSHRSKQYCTPFQSSVAGPHGGVHSFEGCPDVVKSELRQAAELGLKIKRWHSEKMQEAQASQKGRGPVSSAMLPTSLLTPLYKLHQSFVLVDPHLPDMPIVHASAGFLSLTGMPRDKVVGYNCRFMQGPATQQEELAKLREALKEPRPITVRLLNYRYDGTPFWNNLHVAPVRNASGEVVFFVGVQLDITLVPEKTSQLADTAEANTKASEQQEDRETGAQANLPKPAATLDPRQKHGQRSVVGTVRVLCRSLSAKNGLRRSLEDQHRPHMLNEPTQPYAKAPGSERIGMPTLSSSPF